MYSGLCSSKMRIKKRVRPKGAEVFSPRDVVSGRLIMAKNAR